MARIRSLLIGGAIGAAAVYLGDPEQGPARRARLQVELAGAASRLRGRSGVAPLDDSSPPADDDLSLLNRVESAVLRVPGVARGSIEAEAVDRRVVLRGEVASAGQERDVVEAVACVPGAASVESLLTVPGEDR